MWLATDIQALFLDFFFSFIALISTLSASIISKVSMKKSKKFPEGRHFLELLYAVLKTLLILVLLIYSVIKAGIVASNYFQYGVGFPLNIKPVLPYTIAIFIICTAIAINNFYQNKRINNISTMLKAEAKMNMIDGVQSLAIGLASFLLLLTDSNGPFRFLYFTEDFFVTLILVLITNQNLLLSLYFNSIYFTV